MMVMIVCSTPVKILLGDGIGMKMCLDIFLKDLLNSRHTIQDYPIKQLFRW